MQNWLAEEMDLFLKYVRVITDDPEEMSTIIGNNNTGIGNTKKG
jgi:hypothetical protein